MQRTACLASSLLLLGSALLLQPSCAAPRALQSSDDLVRDITGVLVPTDKLRTGGFSVEQRVHGKQGREDVAFQCLVRLERGKLTVFGTTVYSPRAFVIEQQGARVHAEGAALREVPFEPVSVLYDIHRVFFRGLGAQHDGVHERADEGEVVRERWEGGRLVERSFHALDTYSRLVVIRFEGAPAPVIAPRVRITNVRYGYSLTIENGRQQRLEEGGYTLDVEKSAVPEVL